MAETKKKSTSKSKKSDSGSGSKAASKSDSESESKSKPEGPKSTLDVVAEAKAKKSSDAAGDSTSGDTPADYSIGEGQKQVTKKYRQGWDAIFTKKH